MIKLLNSKEISGLQNYLSTYIERDADGLEDILNVWSDAKSSNPVFKEIFKDSLIVKKPVKFKKAFKDYDFYKDDLGRSSYNSVVSLIEVIRDKVWETIDRCKYNTRNAILNVILSDIAMVENSIQKEVIIDILKPEYITADNSYVKEVFLKDKKYAEQIKIQKGTKFTKALRIVGKIVGISEDLIEKYIIYYSRQLQNKITEGNLCFSIHPMDFYTMSDNSIGWGSCLSITQEGCYRSGVTEILTSDNTMLVYLEASKEYSTNYINWNNKKWRAIVLADKESSMAVLGRNYPSANGDLCNVALETLRELTPSVPWDNAVYNNNTHTGIPANPMPKEFRVWHKIAYNDLCHESNFYFSLYSSANDERVSFTKLSLSGPGLCLHCGEEEVEDDMSMLCQDCFPGERCYDCDNIIGYGHSRFETSGGYAVCEYCYDNHYHCCELCDAIVPESESNYIEGGYGTCICDECHDIKGIVRTCDSCEDEYVHENRSGRILNGPVYDATNDKSFCCEKCQQDYEYNKEEKEKEICVQASESLQF